MNTKDQIKMLESIPASELFLLTDVPAQSICDIGLALLKSYQAELDSFGNRVTPRRFVVEGKLEAAHEFCARFSSMANNENHSEYSNGVCPTVPNFEPKAKS